jgi:Transmembrane secretion effector
MASLPAPRASGGLGVLGERNFRLFLAGYTASLIGSAMVPVALTFAVLDQGHGVVAVSAVLAAEFVPLVALLLVGGVTADRFPRRASMLTADVVRCASEALLAVALLTGSATLGEMIVLAGVLGAGQAFYNPALTGLMPQLASAERLQQANAFRGIATSTGQVVGPSLAGIIVAAGGAGWAIAADSATFAISALALLALRFPPQPTPQRHSLVSELAGGWREFRSHTWLWVIVAQFATFNALTVAPFMVLGAVVAHDRLGGAGAWGAILASLGAGSILGGLIAARIRCSRPLIVATLGAAVYALPVALIAIPASTVAIALAAGAAGIGLSIFDALWETTIQREIPSQTLSRVSAYDWFGSIAFVPLGFLLAGPLSTLLGIRATLFLGAGWAAASCALVLSNRSVRRLAGRRRAEAVA